MIADRSREPEAAFRAEPARIEAEEATAESWETVERVAIAIMDADYDQATGGLMSWSDLDAAEQAHFRRLARAAITAVHDRDGQR